MPINIGSNSENISPNASKDRSHFFQASDKPEEFAEITNINFVRRKRIHWPFLLWLYLKTLGLYHKAPFVTVRRCARCKEVGHEQFTTSQSFKLFHCDICESFLWDHEGVVSYITDHDIGASRLNHKFSFVLSNFWLLLILVSTVLLFAVDFIRYEDHNDDLVETISTLCIQGLLTVPVLCVCACNLHSTWPQWAPGGWATALGPVFLVQRLRWVNMRKTRVAGYVLFFLSILFITLQCTRLTQDLYAYGKHVTYITPIDYFTVSIGIFNFAGIAFVVYLLRRSFEKEVRLVCKFTRQHILDMDICRQRLAEAFDTFHKFREFTSGWMSMNVTFAVVSFLLEIHVWITATKPMPYFRYERLIFLSACFILPILAVGNVSVDYLWNRMIRMISRMRSADNEMQWDRIMQFLQEQRPGNRPWQSLMAFILSIIAVFAAIQFRILSSKAINSATNIRSLNVTELYN